MQRFAKMSLACGLIASGLSAAPASAVVLYNSGGFEASAGFVANNYLQGQPANSGTDVWVESPFSPIGSTGPAATTPFAAVYQYVNATAPNFQFVQVTDPTVPTTNSNSFNPLTNVVNPYTPLPGEDVAITWSMSTASANVANHPFFGIIAYGSNGAIGQAGIDGSTGALLGAAGVTTVSSFTAAPDTFYSYELLLDYVAQTYSIYTAPSGGSTFTLREVGSFMDASTDFTDADIASFSADPASGLAFSGTANFDDYLVQTLPIPEPTSVGLVAVAFGLLAKRQRRNRNV